MLEHLNRLVSRDGGEVAEELREGMPALQVVEQGLHGHARAAKHGSAAKDLGIGENLLARVRHHEKIAQRLGRYPTAGDTARGE